MPRDITITFEDGTTHVYKNAPDDVTPKSVYDRASKEFSGKKIVNVDGGRRGGAAAPAAAAEPEASFGQQVLRGAASTADILAEAIPGTAAMIAYPFRRAAGIVTGETAEDIAASQERVLGATAQPIGRATGVAETPEYQNNLARQALSYVAENMDKGADWIAGSYIGQTLGLTKPDVLNMMQSVMALTPAKVPGSQTAGRVIKGAAKKATDVLDPKTAFYMDLAEGRAPELIAAARRPEAEIVPGAKPTFAQATAEAGMPRIAAVGEQAKTEVPGAATRAQAIKDAQEAARVQQLRIIERTPESRARAELVRERRSDPLYTAAETAGNVVNVSPVLTRIDSLIRQNPGNQPLLTALKEVREGLVKPGRNAQGKPILVPRTNAKEISSSIDGLKTLISKKDNEFIKGELTQIKNELTAAVPFMEEAQAAFKKGSRTLNQRDIATYLREKLEAPVPDAAQRASAFAGAVREAPRSIKQALEGAPPYKTFTEAGLSKTQQRMIDDIVIDLSRDARVKELAQAGSKTAPKLMKTPGKVSLPPFFNVIVTTANEILRRMSGKITEKMALDIAMEFLDAQRAAAALETALLRTGKRQAVGRVISAGPRAILKGGAAIEPGVRAGLVTAPNQMRAEENRNRMAR